MLRLLVLLTLCLTSIGYAGQMAITDTGDEVILNSDGTWQYVDGSSQEQSIKTNDEIFTRPETSTFLLKSTRNSASVYINPKEWSFKKGDADTTDAEYEFSLKDGDLYGQIITEGIFVPLENLGEIALDNFKSVAPDGRITKQEYRNVNGIKVMHQEMQGTSQGIAFIFSCYYYSDDSGSTQLVTYTSLNLFEKYQSSIYGLLNGLAVQ